MIIKYTSTSRIERKAEVTIDEVTIEEMLAALTEMMRDGMPGTAEVSLLRNKFSDQIMLIAESIVELPATKQVV